MQASALITSIIHRRCLSFLSLCSVCPPSGSFLILPCFFQSICAHAKAEKDASLSALVPRVRKLLETVIFKVKGGMAEHNVAAAFSVGKKDKERNGHTHAHAERKECTSEKREREREREEAVTRLDCLLLLLGHLKHRNIYGEEVSSQVEVSPPLSQCV